MSFHTRLEKIAQRINPERDPIAGLADSIRAAREAQRGTPYEPMSDAEIMERSAQVRAALQDVGRY